MNDSVTDPWGWVRGGLMWCVTFTRGIAPEEVLTRFGADIRDARLLDGQQAAALMFGTYDQEPRGSVIRVGALGEWSFSTEEYGLMGRMPGPLSALSEGRETFSILKGGDGMNIFEHWRDGRRTEWFEPGYSYTRPVAPHPWWDAAQAGIEAAGSEYTRLEIVMRVVADHTGVVLDDDTLNGPLLGLLLEDRRRTPDPPPPSRPRPAGRPGLGLGRLLGTIVPGDPSAPRADRIPADDHVVPVGSFRASGVIVEGSGDPPRSARRPEGMPDPDIGRLP
ncbi:DUF6461 domain-containing protein [Streptomyces sp. NPDC097640]|uniref:DUF6461 domain-containing protein n=1 Tax=Streptomyces sp. NPDC097640 TaxID=3157229 RepID=UPI0033252DC4